MGVIPKVNKKTHKNTMKPMSFIKNPQIAILVSHISVRRRVQGGTLALQWHSSQKNYNFIGYYTY